MDQRDAVVGVVMAGGSGERMRRSGETVPKPLVRVLGCPLIERNLFALIRAGVREVVVVVTPTGPVAEAVSAWVASRGVALMTAVAGSVRLLVEPAALGNAGALALVGARDRPLLMVFADNLTALELGLLIDDHAARSADLTLAVHDETFVLPYGVVDVSANGLVTGYREKPSLPVRVGSGLAVIGPRAVDGLLARPGAAGLVDLVQWSLDDGLRVVGWPHSAPWADVNDVASAERAELLVRAGADAFEQFWTGDVQVVRWPGSGPDLVTLDDVDGAGEPVRVVVPTEPELLAEPGAGPCAGRAAAWDGRALLS